MVEVRVPLLYGILAAREKMGSMGALFVSASATYSPMTGPCL